MNEQIKKVRQQIDDLDDQIMEMVTKMLRERIGLAQQIGKIKEEQADTANKEDTSKNKVSAEVNYLSPERQAQILKRVKDYAKKHSSPQANIDPEILHNIFNEIISLCLNSESAIKAVYLGPAGTFTQQAALKYFGKSTSITPVNSINQIFREVEVGNSSYGIVPIENSSEGMVTNTMDLLINSSLKIIGEVKLPIHHFLLSHPWTGTIKEVKTIISHQQSLAQCHIWLNANLPDIEIRAESSNARAAQMVKQMPGAAAIAGELNAAIYGLNILARNIEDLADNTTRFIILGKQDTKATGNDKTSIVVGTRNRPGSLYHLLECFYKEQIDLNLLESRPTRMGDWQYNFFIDFYGHYEDDKVNRTISDLKNQTSFCKVLGSYPCATA